MPTPAWFQSHTYLGRLLGTRSIGSQGGKSRTTADFFRIAKTLRLWRIQELIFVCQADSVVCQQLRHARDVPMQHGPRSFDRGGRKQLRETGKQTNGFWNGNNFIVTKFKNIPVLNNPLYTTERNGGGTEGQGSVRTNSKLSRSHALLRPSKHPRYVRVGTIKVLEQLLSDH